MAKRYQTKPAFRSQKRANEWKVKMIKNLWEKRIIRKQHDEVKFCTTILITRTRHQLHNVENEFFFLLHLTLTYFCFRFGFSFQRSHLNFIIISSSQSSFLSSRNCSLCCCICINIFFSLLQSHSMHKGELFCTHEILLKSFYFWETFKKTRLEFFQLFGALEHVLMTLKFFFLFHFSLFSLQWETSTISLHFHGKSCKTALHFIQIPQFRVSFIFHINVGDFLKIKN